MIVVYISSAGGSREIKNQQNEILRYLDSNNIKYFTKDVAASTEIREEMRKKAGNPSALAPQVFNGSQYCGDYQAFFDAVEVGKADKFFKL